MSTSTTYTPAALVPPQTVAVPVPPAPPSSQPTPNGNPRVYNAIYSSIQVYECMVRGIAVMRRRNDSYVNATQILKVAGIDKGRRTKILEKEILPGRHEIVQGGYGKYQGTWIPLERGREVATQFGVLQILQPLFDYVPQPAQMTHLPLLRPGQNIFAYPPGTGFGVNMYSSTAPLQIPYPPQPGTALNVLQNGRSQGLFTPSTTYNLPAGFQFTGLAYSLPQPPTLSTPGNHTSVASVAAQKASSQPPISRDPSTADAAFSSSGPAAAGSSGASSLPPGPVAGQKRSRQDPPPIGPSGSSLATVIESPNKTPSASRVAPAPGPSDDVRSTKRQRLEPAETVDISMEATQPESEVFSPPGSQATTVHQSAASLAPVASLPFIPPNSTVPPPLNVNRAALADLPRPSVRFSTRPPEPPTRSGADRPTTLQTPQARALLNALHTGDDPNAVIKELASMSSGNGGQLDVDAVIDDHGHTALHLAVSLSRLETARRLIALGADVHRGNYAGETPLIRAVLSTAPYEASTFGEILTMLLASLRTVDRNAQSVLHHIAHVAGVRMRAAAARYFMETVLEKVLRQRDESGGTAELVDLQDVFGDTALLISARVGNRALVRMLVDVGANRILGNRLGLRPGDFGVEGETLKVAFAEDYLGALKKGPSPPVQKSQDVVSDLTKLIQNLSSEFEGEIKVKQEALDDTQGKLRAATRELAEQRRKVQECQSSLSELDQVRQRIRNLEKVLKEEDSFDWSGKASADTSRGKGAKGVSVGADVPVGDPDPPFATFTSDAEADAIAGLIRLKRLQTWYGKADEAMQARVEGVKDASAEKEQQCRRVVSLCTGVPVEEVDGMLDNLLIAIESDGQVVDLGRVAGFMQKVGTTKQKE